MKYAVWVALIVSSAWCSPAVAENEHVALFKNVTGKVSIVRDGGSVEAKAGSTVFVADRLVSAPGAAAGIVFKDGSLLTLGPGGDLLVRDYVFEPKDSRYAFSVYLAKGEAIYASGNIGKLAPETVKVSSPTATVGVRGTRFIIRAE